MPASEDLRKTLQRLDGHGYKAYRDIRGTFDFEDFSLHIDRVQADPFAGPSRLRARFPLETAALPEALFNGRVRRIAFEDFLSRRLAKAISRARRPTGTGNGGVIEIDAGGQTVLERSALRIGEDFVEARLQVGLPARGRRIEGHSAADLLVDRLPTLLRNELVWSGTPEPDAANFVECIENQEFIRHRLGELDLVAFVANASILPRRSGANDSPMSEASAIPFVSPSAFELTIEVPNAVQSSAGPTNSLRGMGIPSGVTLIVGGGYHGKSTLLQALEHGVYPHVPGDGREYVVTQREAVKIRAEDGRFVRDVNIEAFVRDLPGGRDTARFSSDDASGSTSQASAIAEAIEVGAKTLLIDEDTSATNFMVRDALMRKLIAPENEPITPFLDRVRELHDRHGVSTILVMGGVGDYFAVADRVIAMADYQPRDATAEAKAIATESTPLLREDVAPMQTPSPRIPLRDSFDPSRGRRSVKIDVRGRDGLLFGKYSIDLRCVSQLEERSQGVGVGHAMHLAAERFMDGERNLHQVLDDLDAYLDEVGIDAINAERRGQEHPGNFSRPRRFEIAAAINRLATLRLG